MPVRKRADAMTAAERTRFRSVLTQLINAPVGPPGGSNAFGQLVAEHSNMMHNMHGSMGPVGAQRFLPWHRVYLLTLERMGAAIDSQFFIPYWDWTTQRTVPSWLVSFRPTVRVPGPDIPVFRDPGPPPPLPTRPQLAQLLGRTTFTSFTFGPPSSPRLEQYHNDVHGWVGGSMADLRTAPADPIFWMHHAMIDKVWADWQVRHPGRTPTLAGADATMDPWPQTEQQVRSIASLGYSYQ